MAKFIDLCGRFQTVSIHTVLHWVERGPSVFVSFPSGYVSQVQDNMYILSYAWGIKKITKMKYRIRN